MSGTAEPTATLPEMVVTADPVPPPDPADVALVVNGHTFAGWQEVRITRGVERLPSDFQLTATEASPDPAHLDITPSAPCVLNVRGDLVLTGYVDRYTPAISYSSHSVTFQGRSKCADLVDSSALFEDEAGNDVPTQIAGASCLEVATRLAAPHGITVSAPDTPGPVIPQHTAMLTETPWELIERVARYSKLLAYDDRDGNLVLAQVGTEKHASGFAQGINVETAAVTYSWDQRFTRYDVLYSPYNNLGDVTEAANGNPGWNRVQRLTDESSVSARHDGGARKRRRVIMVENQWGGPELALARAEWERARRWGRSQAAQITCDSWRDSAGVLWEPNHLARIDLPACKLVGVEWVIVEVTYRRGIDGEHADVLLMPPEAIMPQPTILQPFDGQMASALAEQPAP